MDFFFNYVGTFLRELIFFSSDVKTTTIAIAVTSSVCCSVLWLLIHFVAVATRNNANCKQDPHLISQNGSSYHLQRKGSLPGTALFRRSCSPVSSKKSFTKSWSVEKGCDLQQDKMDSCKKKPQHMDLSHMKLSQCPDRVGFMGPQLTGLSLANNTLSSVPTEIGFLLGLTKLNLSNNRLSIIPESIRNLRNLEELDLRHNRLCNLPPAIGQLLKLRNLCVGKNQLTSLPKSIGKLKAMHIFSASNNLLEEIPEEFCQLSELTILRLQSNHISALPPNMHQMIHLTELDVSHNRLMYLPCDVTKCAFLQSLKLSHNNLRTLPSAFHRLHELKELYISNNKLRYLPLSLQSVNLVIKAVNNNPLWSAYCVKPYEAQCCNAFPSLLEFSARIITREGIPWWKHHLPRELQDTLHGIDQCGHCGNPLLVQKSITRLKYYVFPDGHKLPLHQVICPSYYSKVCSFMEYN